MNLCSDSNIENCDQDKVPKKLEKKLQKCNFEGKLTNDPDSVVNLVGCIGGSLDISVMSSKANLTQNVYRQHPDGEIEVPKIGFSDEVKKTRVEEKTGSDYTLFTEEKDSSEENEVSYVDAKGSTITMVRDETDKNCCRPVKITCKGKKNDTDKKARCKVNQGKPCCGGKGKCSCKKLRKFILSKKRNMARAKSGKSSRKKRKNRKTKGKRKKGKGKWKGKGKRRGRRKKKKDISKKILSELSKDDLKNLMISLKVQSRKKNPKCQPKNKFMRSRQLMILNCPSPCRSKEPIPEKKIYQQRTVEFGIFTDRALYNQMAVSLFRFKNHQSQILFAEVQGNK